MFAASAVALNGPMRSRRQCFYEGLENQLYDLSAGQNGRRADAQPR